MLVPQVPPLGSCTKPGSSPSVVQYLCGFLGRRYVSRPPSPDVDVLYFAKPENRSHVLREPESPEAAAHSGEIHTLAFD